MPTNVRIHVAAGGLLIVLVTVIALFWSFPKLLVYVLLAIVAALAYGALYLILAAWMDPKEEQPTTADIPPRVHDTSDVTQPDVTVPGVKAAPRKPARKPRKKAKTTRKKKTKKTK